jgi:hypothetical protein
MSGKQYIFPYYLLYFSCQKLYRSSRQTYIGIYLLSPLGYVIIYNIYYIKEEFGGHEV